MSELDGKSQDINLNVQSITDVSAGGKHSMVLSGDGKVYTFGFGD